MTAEEEIIQGITNRERFHEYFPMSVENGRKMLALLAELKAHRDGFVTQMVRYNRLWRAVDAAVEGEKT